MKAGKLYRAARWELQATREARGRLGIRLALAERVRTNLELQAPGAEMAELRRERGRDAEVIAELQQQVAATHDSLATVQRWLTAIGAEAAELRELVAGSAWAETVPRTDMLITVLMATRDRAHLLPDAIASVLAQTHPQFELVVIDDGSVDDTPSVVAAIDDPRVRLIRREREERRGPNRAFNAGLQVARGEVIAYLDDDNAWRPHWLATVAAAFDRRPDVDVVYGGRVFDPHDDSVPPLQWVGWDRRLLEDLNFLDQNVFAHRAGLAEAVYDESMPSAGDWEIVLRLTAGKPPLRVPYIAAAYRTDTHERVSARSSTPHSYSLIQRKLLDARPLRVLGVTLTPPPAEGAPIRAGLDGLDAERADVAWGPYAALEHALADFLPDLLVLDDLGLAVDHLPRLEDLAVPFAVLAADGAPDTEAALAAHPQCIGVWTEPAPSEVLGERLRGGVERWRCARAGWPTLRPRQLESGAPA